MLEKKRPKKWIKGGSASCNTGGSGIWRMLWRLKESTWGTLPIQRHLGQAAASSFFTGKEDSCCWEFTLEASTVNHNLIIKALSSYAFIITNGATEGLLMRKWAGQPSAELQLGRESAVQRLSKGCHSQELLHSRTLECLLKQWFLSEKAYASIAGNSLHPAVRNGYS